MRKDARKVAFSLIYEYLFTRQKDDLLLEQFTKKEDADDTIFEIDDMDKQYVSNLYDSVIKKFDYYQQKVAQLADGFKSERLFKVDLAILMMAFCELDAKETPLPIVINEAVNLAKIYSTENSAGFINGILAEYSKTQQTD